MRFFSFLSALVFSSLLLMPPVFAERPTVGLRQGQLAPEVKGDDLDGRAHRLKDYKGSYVVLHFWATWCPHCRSEVPKLKTVRERYGDKVSVLAVSVDEDQTQVKRFAAAERIPYTVIPDANSDFANAQNYRVAGIPVTYVLDPEGVILTVFQGASDMVGYFDRLLGQSASAGAP